MQSCWQRNDGDKETSGSVSVKHGGKNAEATGLWSRAFVCVAKSSTTDHCSTPTPCTSPEKIPALHPLLHFFLLDVSQSPPVTSWFFCSFVVTYTYANIASICTPMTLLPPTISPVKADKYRPNLSLSRENRRWRGSKKIKGVHGGKLGVCKKL